MKKILIFFSISLAGCLPLLSHAANILYDNSSASQDNTRQFSSYSDGGYPGNISDGWDETSGYIQNGAINYIWVLLDTNGVGENDLNPGAIAWGLMLHGGYIGTGLTTHVSIPGTTQYWAEYSFGSVGYDMTTWYSSYSMSAEMHDSGGIRFVTTNIPGPTYRFIGRVCDYNCPAPTSPVITPTISFVYPTNGTTTDPFDKWGNTLSNLTSTDQYQIQIHWAMMNHACGYSQLYGTINYCQIYGDTSPFFTGNATGTVATLRPDRNLSYQNDGFDSDDWYAIAYVNDITTHTNTVATTSIIFTLNRYTISNNTKPLGGNGTAHYTNVNIGADGTLIISTSTSGYIGTVQGGAGFNVSSTCPNDPVGLCTAANYIFGAPEEVYTQAMRDQVATLQTRFPISLYYAFASAATSSMSATSTATTTMSISFPAMAGAPTTSFTIMSPTILIDAGVSQSFKDEYFSVARNVLWLTTGIGAIIIPFM